MAVISAEECERLRRDRPALRVEDLPDELAALADAIAAAAPPEEARRFDGEVD